MASIAKPARPAFFTTEKAAVAAIKNGNINKPATCSSSSAAARPDRAMEETYQVTSALKYLDFGKHVAVITDARFLRRLNRRMHSATSAPKPSSAGRLGKFSMAI